jgi:hypothetical protein
LDPVVVTVPDEPFANGTCTSWNDVEVATAFEAPLATAATTTIIAITATTTSPIAIRQPIPRPPRKPLRFCFGGGP